MILIALAGSGYQYHQTRQKLAAKHLEIRAALQSARKAEALSSVLQARMAAHSSQAKMAAAPLVDVWLAFFYFLKEQSWAHGISLSALQMGGASAGTSGDVLAQAKPVPRAGDLKQVSLMAVGSYSDYGALRGFFEAMDQLPVSLVDLRLTADTITFTVNLYGY